MRKFPFYVCDEDFRAFRPYWPEEGARNHELMHQCAAKVLHTLLNSGLPPFTLLSNTSKLPVADHTFACQLVDLLRNYQALESLNPRSTTGTLETSILYEYHPYIELLREFFIRQHGYTTFEYKAYQPLPPPQPPKRYMRPVFDGSILQEANNSLLLLPAMPILGLQPLSDFLDGRVKLSRKDALKILEETRSLITDLHSFLKSTEAKEYLVLREKTYSRVYDKTIQYAKSIVERYGQCAMVMTELRFAGDCWDDESIRDCADRVGGLMSLCFESARRQGVLGHAWRLDTVLTETKSNFLGKTVWRVRWLTFVRLGLYGPAMSGEMIATHLHVKAERSLAGLAVSMDFSSAVIKSMTKLSVESQSVSESPEGVAGYKQAIERWVYELSIGEIYHRIRILEGRRPMMCGRGHPSDGRPKKQRMSKKGVSLSRVDSAL